ncbi:hypothetical protein P8452_63851 [Trifolium repens]|nr:hypothetical protein P8452_63851 [Trifolium repens]
MHYMGHIPHTKPQVQVESSLFCLQVLSFYEGNSASYELYRKLNISIIKNGVIHKRRGVEESLKELSLIVNGVVMSYITTQAAAETLILSTGGLKKTFL